MLDHDESPLVKSLVSFTAYDAGGDTHIFTPSFHVRLFIIFRFSSQFDHTLFFSLSTLIITSASSRGICALKLPTRTRNPFIWLILRSRSLEYSLMINLPPCHQSNSNHS